MPFGWFSKSALGDKEILHLVIMVRKVVVPMMMMAVVMTMRMMIGDDGGRDQRDSRFSRILQNFFYFHFSFSISSCFNFTFTSRKRVKGFYFSLFTSRKKWKLFVFHSFFLEKKEWNQVRAITSPLSLFPIVFPKIVKSQVSTSLKILAKFQFQNLDQTLCSKSEPNISLKKVTKTRLKFNCAHLRSTKESLTFKYFDTGRYWLVLGQYRTVRVDIW